MSSLAVKIYQFYIELFKSGQLEMNLKCQLSTLTFKFCQLFNTKLADLPE